MPTILILLGWRLFFYANEGSEPVHIHCRKGDMECKFWIIEDSFDIEDRRSLLLRVGAQGQEGSSPNHLRTL